MITHRYRLYIERRDADRNMARFYSLSIEPSLFGEICLVRRWGRIGTHGRSMTHPCETEDAAVLLFLDLLRQKRQRGYAALGSPSMRCAAPERMPGGTQCPSAIR
ncbi:WGR domain-containing protein [Aureimonas ureilytica]|uniref:WGR domain-containing protein n=1 Tax=Aureimonas ureilytica TaxID=401562 RepID=UPI0009E9F712|nr:WGR domain-containing protein [Aureimonas ureilytica]